MRKPFFGNRRSAPFLWIASSCTLLLIFVLSTPAILNKVAPFWFTVWANTNFQAVETFDLLTIGGVNSQNGWQAATVFQVVPDPVDNTNKVLQVQAGDYFAYKALPTAIANGAIGTLHFRIRRHGLMDGHAGLSDLAAPLNWNSFEAQLGAQSHLQPTQFVVNDGGVYDIVSNGFVDQTWFCVWLVVNNTSDTYQAYVKGGSYTQPTLLDAAGQTTFQFRNLSGSDPLATFLIGVDYRTNTSFYVDDIFVDTSGENLTIPGHDCNPSSPQGFQRLEDFESMNPGALGNQNGWNATTNIDVTTDPVNSANRVLRLGPRLESQAYKPFPVTIDNNALGTLYFRLRRDGGINGHVGASDLASPVDWEAYEVQVGAISTPFPPDKFVVRDGPPNGGAEFPMVSNLTFNINTWYCVWLVANNSVDSFSVYAQTAADPRPTQLIAAGKTSFAFRHGGSDPLRTFLARIDPNTEGNLYVDDIYVDGSTQNLSSPVAACTGETASTVTPSPTATSTATASSTSTATATPTVSPTPTTTPTATPVATGDPFEDDNNCSSAKTIPMGDVQTHTFHITGDSDWVKFTGQANKTYLIRAENGKADVVITLFDACDLPPNRLGNDAFGNTVITEVDSVRDGDYFIKLEQFDGASGADLDYKLSVTADTLPPPEPSNVRCVTIDTTTLGVQWQKSPGRDVRRYLVQFVGLQSGNVDVNGADVTFTAIPNLTPGQSYEITVRAFDFSNNVSNPTFPLPCKLQSSVDATIPAITLESPGSAPVISTTSTLLTFSGQATDLGSNLSRVEVHNMTTNISQWDFNLTGGSSTFRVENLAMQAGDNRIEIKVYDAAGNAGKHNMLVKRLEATPGAALIIAGRNELNALQVNIYNIANRAYRIFRNAGYTEAAIFYIAPVQQDADNDGVVDDVDSQPGDPPAIQSALLTWAQAQAGPGKPLFVYMIDHGFVDKFCVAGCNSPGFVTPADLAGWLTQLETTTGADQVNVIIEACLSGSFITRVSGADENSLSSLGRVVITSTSDHHNAYASATGAYFSDAFFSCLADSNNLKACFDEARTALTVLGVQQLPQLDDNGDGVYNSNADGAIAQERLLTRFFAARRPTIINVDVERDGANGVLTATVEEGAEAINAVWAAIYPPNFNEPDDPTNHPTLNLNLPTVRLLPGATIPGQFRREYPNGFVEAGVYRVIFYAQDNQGIHAIPKRFEVGGLYLPLLIR